MDAWGTGQTLFLLLMFFAKSLANLEEPYGQERLDDDKPEFEEPETPQNVSFDICYRDEWNAKIQSRTMTSAKESRKTVEKLTMVRSEIVVIKKKIEALVAAEESNCQDTTEEVIRVKGSAVELVEKLKGETAKWNDTDTRFAGALHRLQKIMKTLNEIKDIIGRKDLQQIKRIRQRIQARRAMTDTA